MTTTERYMTDFTTALHDALDDREAADREPDAESDDLYGLAWPAIVAEIDADAAERWLEDQSREWLAWERRIEYWQ